jgi:hypothetical protein
MWRFHPFTFNSEKSLPNCTPAKVSSTFNAHETVPLLGRPGTAGVKTPAAFVVFFTVTSPPTPRTQTPPPSWFGSGLAGLPIKAVLWSRNAVLAVVIVEPITLATAAGEDPAATKGKLLIQVWARTSQAENSVTANVIPTTVALQWPRQPKFLPNLVVV